jgi:predicted transcriptional regulator
VIWEDIASERKELVRLLQEVQPSWQGTCELLEISNRTGQNVERLRDLLAAGILKAAGKI